VLRRLVRPVLAGACALTIGSMWPAPASATVSGAAGTCSIAPTWYLRASPSDGAIWLRYTVTSAGPGEVWGIRIRHGRALVFADRRITGDDGSFTIRRPFRDLPGTDAFRARAYHRATGELCLSGIAVPPAS